jgi:hypothetical protein
MARAAVVMTVKNERDVLRSNILFHRHLGVERFYVFPDDDAEGTGESVADLDFVQVSESMSAARFLASESRRQLAERSRKLARAVEDAELQHTARQMLNAFVAMEKARERGIEWLLAIDADELVCPRIERAEAGEFATLLDTVDPRTEQVRFRPLEIVQQDRSYRNVFGEAVLFKRPDVRVARPVYDPFREKFKRFERKDVLFRRLSLSKIRRFDWWYGHHEGKAVVRVDLDVVPLIHRFEGADGRNLTSGEGGYLLHYFMYDVQDFIKKYRSYVKQPDRWVAGATIPYRKRLWRDLVNDPAFSEDSIRSYYRRWIAFDEVEVERLRNRSMTISVPAARDVFDSELGRP